MISILMPVYNVEKYIEKTLESIKNQTYSDFEVIMVDDGSTDSSGLICDKWAQTDSRFRVIHTDNAGVSAARNTALSLVKGEYIFFMDSDDIIIPETLEELFDALVKNDADISMGTFYYSDNDGNSVEKLNKNCPVKDEVLDNIQYLEKLTQPGANYYCTSTTKIFKATLFNDIVYPVGKINEDEAKIHEIIYKCKKIVTLKKRYYNYIKHSAGITGTAFGLKNLDREDAFVARINFFKEKNLHDLAKKSAIFALDSAIVTFTKCVKNNFYYGKTTKRIDSYFRFFMENCPGFLKLSAFEKKVYTIGKIIINSPQIYVQYIEFLAKLESAGIPEAVRELVFNFILKFFSYLPAKNRIVFESNPELTCNTYPVFKYLTEQGLNEKYEFVWLTLNPDVYNKQDYKNTSFCYYTKTAAPLTKRIKTMYYMATSKALVYSNRFLGYYGKNKISLWLQHGMPLKASNGTYCIKNQCSAALCMSEFFKENFSADARVEEDKMIFLGFPRNDLLLTDNDSLAKFGFDKYNKVIFWLPTFRQRANVSKKSKLNDFEMEVTGTGIPSIETAEEMQKVNEYLKANNCLLVLKPHPIQNLSAMKEINLSNFFIINDNTLKEKGVQLYELLGRCDAMITDYSSVFYDFLITDKPIGLTTGDIGEYIAKRGFVYKNPLDILKGEYIYNTDDLISFIGNVITNNDIAKEERTAVKNMIHKIKTPDSAKLVGDYIISQLENLK